MQDLSALGFLMQGLRQELGSQLDPDLRSRLLEGLEQVQATVANVEKALRSLTHSLHQERSERQPFLEALRVLIEQFRSQTKVSVDLSIEGGIEPATDSQRIALLRVSQEALNNIAKHADATRVLIRLRQQNEQIELTIHDDGIGFDPDSTGAQTEQSGRLGLTGMAERIRLLGGQFRIDSHPGGPTTISARLERWRPAET